MTLKWWVWLHTKYIILCDTYEFHPNGNGHCSSWSPGGWCSPCWSNRKLTTSVSSKVAACPLGLVGNSGILDYLMILSWPPECWKYTKHSPWISMISSQAFSAVSIPTTTSDIRDRRTNFKFVNPGMGFLRISIILFNVKICLTKTKSWPSSWKM